MDAVLRAGVDWFLGKLGLKPTWEQDRASFTGVALSFPWLEDLQLPFRVHCGRVGKLEVGLPREAGSGGRWLAVDASDVNVIIVPFHLDEWDLDMESMEQAAVSARQRLLRGLSLSLLPSACADIATGGLPEGLCTHRALEGLLRWIRLDIRRVHIRYEDPVTNPRFMFSGGLFVQHITLGDAPAAGEDPSRRREGGFAKRAVVQASAYWQSYAAELLAGAPQWEAHMAQHPPCQEQEEERGTWPAVDVLPLTDLEVDFSCPCPRTGARFSVALSAPHFLPRPTHAMLGDLRLVLDLAGRWRGLLGQRCECATRLAALEPAPEAEAGAAARWHRALRCVRRLLRERAPVRHRWRREVHDLLRLQRLYLDLVEQELVELEAACAEERAVCLDLEVQHCLGQLESVLPIDLLKTWRLQAGGHASFPKEDLAALGIRRSAGTPIQASASTTPSSAIDVALTVTVRRLGLCVQEIAVPNPLQRIPFDIVSRSAYTSAFQSADWPVSHPVVERAMGQQGGPGSSSPRKHRRAGKPWVYLGGAGRVPAGERAGGEGAAGPRCFELALRQLHLRSELSGLRVAPAGEPDVMLEIGVQQVRLGRPSRDERRGRTDAPLLSCSSTPQRPSALHCAWRRRGGERPECLRLLLGECVMGVTCGNLEDPIFLLFDVFPQRSGVKVHHCQNSLLPLALPARTDPFDVVCNSLLGANELSLRLDCLKIFAMVMPTDTGVDGPVEALLELQGLDVAVPPPEGAGQDRTWSCAFVEAQLSLPAQPRHPQELAAKTAPFPGLGPIHSGGCGVAGGTASAHVSAVHVLGSRVAEGDKAAAHGEGSILHMHVCVPKCEIRLEEGQTLARMHQLAHGLLACVPPRRHRCVMASRVRLWYPPAHPAMRSRRMMRKEGPASSGSESGSDTGSGQSCGHWSCDMWAELLANGALELYSHPRQRTPIYSLWPLEVRGGGDPYSTPAVASQQHPPRRLAREMEVRIALPAITSRAVGASQEASGKPLPLGSQSVSSAPSAWIYLRCVDQLSQHWVHKWRLLEESLRRHACFGEVPPPSRCVWHTSPRPCLLQLTVLDGQLDILNAFEPAIRARCQGLSSQVHFKQRQMQVSVEALAMENLAHEVSDKRRFLLSAALESRQSTEAAVDGAGRLQDFLVLSMSPKEGLHLNLVPLSMCLDPLLVLRAAHAWRALVEFGYGVRDWPVVGSWWQEASDLYQSALADSARVFGESGMAQSPGADSVGFSCNLPSVDVCCVQSFTGFVVGGAELRQLGCAGRARRGQGRGWEEASCNFGALRLRGCSGRCLLEALPPAPAASASGDAGARAETEPEEARQAAEAEVEAETEQEEAREEMEVEAASCLRAACRREQRAGLGVLRLEAAGGPVRMEWRQEESCRLAEFWLDIANALSWSFWRPPRRGPPAGAGPCEPLQEQPCAFQADVHLQLPSLHISGGSGGHCPSIDVELGELHVTSAIDEEFNFSATGGPEGEETIGLPASVLHLSWNRALAVRLTDPGQEPATEGEAGHSGQSGRVSEGTTVSACLAVQVALDGPCPQVRQALLRLEAPDVLSLSVPAACFQALRRTASPQQVLAPAPGLPRQDLRWLWRRLLGRAWSALGGLELTVRAELAGARAELLDAADRQWLEGELLQLRHRQHGLGCRRSPGSLEFSIRRLGVRAILPEAAEPLDVLRLQRPCGSEEDVAAVLSRTQKQKASSGEPDDSQTIDTWEMQVSVGEPTLKISSVLVAYFRHLAQCTPAGMASGETGTTVPSETASASDDGTGAAEMRSQAAVLLRRAQAMAAERHRALLSEMARPAAGGAPPAAGRAPAARPPEVSPVVLRLPGAEPRADPGAEGCAAAFAAELQSGAWRLELLGGDAKVAVSMSTRLTASASAKVQKTGMEAVWALTAGQCQLAFGGRAEPRVAIPPFKISASAQHRQPVVAPAEGPAPRGREAGEETPAKAKLSLQIAGVAMLFRWEDLLLLEDWLASLLPARPEPTPSGGLAAWWHEPPRLPSDAVKLQDPPRWRSRAWLQAGLSYLASLSPAELTASCGGLSCTLQDAEGDAIKVSTRPLEVHRVNQQAAGGRQAEHQSQVVVEVEAWNAWAGAWEPVFEPCELTAALALAGRQRALSLHCAQVRLCLKLKQLQDLRRRLGRALAERGVAGSRGRGRQAQLWRCSPTGVPQRWPLALADLNWSVLEGDAVEDHEDHELPHRRFEGSLSSARGFRTVHVDGPPLRVRNLTGCPLLLQEATAEGAFSGRSGDTWRLAAGEERAIGRVGIFGAMDVFLEVQSAGQPTVEAPIRAQMACLAPGVRALPIPWAGAVLWQEVSSIDSGVLCRFRSPVIVSNQTPLELELEYGGGTLQRIPNGDVIGLHLAALAQGASLRMRPVLQEHGDWSESIVLPLDEGTNPSRVVSCGPRCELVAEVSASDGQADERAAPGRGAGHARLSLTLRPRCSFCNMLPIPFQVRAAASCWPSGSEHGSPLELRPGETQAAMVSTLGQSHLWLSLSLGGCQGAWSLPQCVPLSSRLEAPTVVSWDARPGGSAASAFQVEVRSLAALHGQGLAPRIVLALCIRHVVLLQCPFPMRLLAPVNPGSHMTRLAPAPLGNGGPQLWLVHSKVFELHGGAGPGLSAAVHVDLALEGGALAARVGEHDVTVAKATSPIVPFVESETICLTILPRFWIMNHLRCDIEVKQVQAGAELGDPSPMLIRARTGTALHCTSGEEGLPAVVLRPRRSGADPANAWSGAVGLCRSHRCSLALGSGERQPEVAVWVEAVRCATGQWALHISPAAAAELHVENHTHMALFVRQHRAERAVRQLPPLTAAVFAWRDALELARCAAGGRQAVLQLQSERWREGEWLSLDPYVPCRCSARHGDTALYAHTRREGSTHVVVVTTSQHIGAWQEPNYVDASPESRDSFGDSSPPAPRCSTPSATQHIRATCAELSVSLVGAHSELFRLTAFGIAAGSDCFERSLKLLGSIEFMRLDHLAPGAGLPTLLRTAPTSSGPFLVVGASQELEPSVPLLPLCRATPELRFPASESGELLLEYLDARASELWLAAHVRSVMGSALPFLVAVLGSADEARQLDEAAADEDGAQQLALSSCRGRRAPAAAAAAPAAAPPPGRAPLRVRVGDLRVSPLGVLLAASLRDFDPAVLGGLCPTPPEVKRTLRRLSLTDLQDEHVVLEGLEWHGVAASSLALADATRHHYACALRDQLHAVLAAGGGASSEDAYGVADYMLQGLHTFVGAPPDSLEGRDGRCPGPGSRAHHTQTLLPGGEFCLGHFCGRNLSLQVLEEDAGPPAAASGTRAPPQRAVGKRRVVTGPSCGELLEIEPGVAGGLRSAGQALLGLFLRPLAGVLGPSSGEASLEAVRAGAASPRAVAEAPPPPPRLLRGPHRLARPRRQEDEEAQRLLAELAFDLGADACYEDHALSSDPGRLIILTDCELLLARTAPAHVERRWALDGVEPGSVRADGAKVLFTAQLGVSDGEELRVGPSSVRCTTAAAARGLATGLRTAAAEAHLAGVLPRQRLPDQGTVLVSL